MSGKAPKAPLDETSIEPSVDYDIITGQYRTTRPVDNVDSLGNTMLGMEVKERFSCMRDAFLKMDINQDGRITANEIRGLCRQWNIPMSEADRVLEAADLDANGTMDFNEFAQRFDPDYDRHVDGDPLAMSSSTAYGAIYDDRPIASSGWAKFDDMDHDERQASQPGRAARQHGAARNVGKVSRGGSHGGGRRGPGPPDLQDRDLSASMSGGLSAAMSTPAGSGIRAAKSIRTEELTRENLELKDRVSELEAENARLREELAAYQQREAGAQQREAASQQREAQLMEQLSTLTAAVSSSMDRAHSGSAHAGHLGSTGGLSPTSSGGMRRGITTESDGMVSPSRRARGGMDLDGMTSPSRRGKGGMEPEAVVSPSRRGKAGKGNSVHFEDEAGAEGAGKGEDEEPQAAVVVYGRNDCKKTQAVMSELKKNKVPFDAFDLDSTKAYMSALEASGFPANSKVRPPIVVVHGKVAFWDEPDASIAVHFPGMVLNGLRRLGLVKAGDVANVPVKDVTMDVEIAERFHNMQDAFLAMDDDRDGVISKDELLGLCREWNIPQSEAERIIKESDFDASGRLDFREFSRRFGR